MGRKAKVTTTTATTRSRIGDQVKELLEDAMDEVEVAEVAPPKRGKKSAISTGIQQDDIKSIKPSKTGIITIPGVKTEELKTLIIGTAPLICHKFSEKLRKQILDKHMGEASAGRDPKDPKANFEAARYRLTDRSDGVPAGGIKAAIVDGFGKDTGVFVTKAKGAIRVHPDDTKENLVRIITPSEPRMREDVVRNESGVVDIRHRPEYWPWAMLLTVEYLPQIVSGKQVMQAIARSGFTVGLCEWRPSSKQSKSGSWGTWRLATPEEVEDYEDGDLFETYAVAAE